MMQERANSSIDDKDKGPTEKMRDEAKSEDERVVTEEAGVPGAQKPGDEEIKDEKKPNTE
jgi:hypothetical protein